MFTGRFWFFEKNSAESVTYYNQLYLLFCHSHNTISKWILQSMLEWHLYSTSAFLLGEEKGECERSKFSTHSKLLFRTADFSHFIFPAQGQHLDAYTNCTDASGAPRKASTE